MFIFCRQLVTAHVKAVALGYSSKNIAAVTCFNAVTSFNVLSSRSHMTFENNVTSMVELGNLFQSGTFWVGAFSSLFELD